MNCFILSPAVNSSETGAIYPQIQKMSPGYNYNSLDSVYSLTKAHNYFPNESVDLNFFIVHGKAKLTDMLSNAIAQVNGFLISPKLKSLIEQFNLPSHKFYPARIFHIDTFYEYYWFHILCDLSDSINYLKSSFFIYYNYNHDLGEIEIVSKVDAIQKKDKIKKDNPGKTISLKLKNIRLNSHIEKKFDLFEIGMFDYNYYISERLKEKLEREKISGLQLKPATNILFD